MKTEFKILIYSMVNNFIISIIKIFSGLFFNLGSLIADGLHTFCDFFTDIICLIGAKISKKRPTKYHPFGFGKVEYLTNLFVGIILLLLGIYIIFHSFKPNFIIPPLYLLWILLFTIVLKIIAIIIMNKIGKNINSQLLITSVKESKIDLYSSVGVIFVTVLLQFSKTIPFFKYCDMIYSFLIGLLVLKISIEIIIDNSLSIIGEIDYNEQTINEINKTLNEIKEIQKNEIQLIKYGAYFKLQLTLQLDSNLTLKQISKLESKIKKQLFKQRKLKIKYITIYVTNDL